MSDIVERMRRWTHDPQVLPASDLIDEAADEIRRLRGELVPDAVGLFAFVRSFADADAAKRFAEPA